MTVWRLARAVHPAIDGEGARRQGGRWNEAGTPAVYTSEHLSLAVLEALVHADPDLLPDDLTAYRIEVPDDLADPALRQYDEGSLPDDWRDAAVSVAVGQAWSASGGPVLVVPSVVVPHERNVLVNPLHPEAARVHVASQEPFSFDSRLFHG